MNKLAVYQHENGLFSAPFCPVGRARVYEFVNPKYIRDTDSLQACHMAKCTCSNPTDIVRKASDDIKREFHKKQENYAKA